MEDFLVKLFGPDWYKNFWIYLGVFFALDVLLFSSGLDWDFFGIISYLVGIILIITIYLLWLVYKRITPKIIQSSLSKIKLLMPFDENGQVQKLGCLLWGIVGFIQVLAAILWVFRN